MVKQQVVRLQPSKRRNMAGLTAGSSLQFRPFLCKPSPKPLSVTSFNSCVFFSYRFFGNFRLCVSSSSSFLSIFARNGGGGGSFRRSWSDDDQALDLSSIRSDKVRLIDERQNMVGMVSKSEAVQMADDTGLDLVILSPDADPPVVRIMDYNKYRYELQKKKKGQQKRSSANRMDLKELKMGYNIDVHDYSVRLRAAQKFLKDGDKVKVIVNLKGRENEFRNNAIELIRRFQNDLGELAIEETKNLSDRNIFLVLVPNKVVVQKIQEALMKKDKSTADEIPSGV